MKSLLVKVLVLLLLAIPVDQVGATNVAVLLSSDAAAYQEALEGFREVTRHKIVGVQTLKDNPATWRDELKKLRTTIEPDLVFVIGTSALQAVAGEITNIPIVHAMVFNPFAVGHSSAKNITGISMIPPANQSIALLRELNPKYGRIGVIYDPARSGPLFLQARSASQKENVKLVAKEVRSPGDIASALKSLENEIDALWLWPDEAYLGEEILQRIFLFSFERKVPVLGLSERHTQMGAALSLSYASAKDMGGQAGQAANRLLGEAREPYASTVAPRQTKLTVNLKTARKLGVDVPESIIQRADNAVKAPIYKEGEWWVFKTKTMYRTGETVVEEHRLTFTNGAFATDAPSFLRGEDIAGRPTFLPFASVYLTDPRKKWLEFPLLPGKQWDFSYYRSYYSGRASRGRRGTNFTWGYAKAEAIDYTSQPVVTPAGKFDVMEISRVDSHTPQAYLTYFYSPQTKTVVKLKAYIDPGDSSGSGRQFELELIAYGQGSAPNKAASTSPTGK